MFFLLQSVLDLTDRMGNSMEFQGEIANIKAPALALSMIDVDPDEFSGLTFGVSLTATMNPEVRRHDGNFTSDGQSSPSAIDISSRDKNRVTRVIEMFD